MKLWTIGTHERAHFDEMVGIWQLKRFGESKYPGISGAPVYFSRDFTNAKIMNPIFVGIGNGEYDEHKSGGRKTNECAATLVANGLGIVNDPALGGILEYTRNRDSNRIEDNPYGEFEIASAVKLFYAVGRTEHEVMEIVFQFLDAKYEEQRRFHHDVREEYERTAVIEEINGPHGLIKMATIITDSGQMNAFARSKQGGQIAIIVQQSPTTGSIQIFTNSYNRLQLFDLAKMIRLEEQECRDGMVTVTDWRRLASEGTMDEVPEWYFHTKGQMLLNGSTTATNITPTKISLMRIKELIRIALDPNTFESPDCKRLCWSSRREPCPWFKWGMTRCYKLRQARGEY